MDFKKISSDTKNRVKAESFNGDFNRVCTEHLIKMINEFFEIEKKQKKMSEKNSIDRNLRNIHAALINLFGDNNGLEIHNPLNETYDDTRYDCEAKISGNLTSNMVIIDVIKPIIRLKQNDKVKIIQKAIVIVQGGGNE